MTGPRWLLRRAHRPDADAVLYCFAHAGGSAGEYVRWSDDLPGVQVWAVQLPGRGSRRAEPSRTRMTDLVHALVDDVRFDPPFAFFGHSLGGLMAFEVTRRLRELGREQPERLFLSSAPPPPVRVREPLHDLSDDGLLAGIERRWGRLPDAVRGNPAALELALGCFRADFEVFETYRHEPGEPLDRPITALAGDREELRVDGWRAHTRAAFDLRLLPGGHFHLREQRHQVLRLIRETIDTEGT